MPNFCRVTYGSYAYIPLQKAIWVPALFHLREFEPSACYQCALTTKAFWKMSWRCKWEGIRHLSSRCQIIVQLAVKTICSSSSSSCVTRSCWLPKELLWGLNIKSVFLRSQIRRDLSGLDLPQCYHLHLIILTSAPGQKSPLTFSHCSACSLLCTARTRASAPWCEIFSSCFFFLLSLGMYVILQSFRSSSIWGCWSLELL